MTLQRDQTVHKGCDICRLLECCLSLWLDGQFDGLLQETQRCDRALLNSHCSSSGNDRNHIVKVLKLEQLIVG